MLRVYAAVLLCVGVELATARALPTTEAPTPAPGLPYPCQETTDLNETAGNVTYEKSMVEFEFVCWYFECDNEVVITLHSFALGSDTLLYYSNGGAFSSGDTNVPVALQGQIYLQLAKRRRTAQVEFDLTYMCVDATPAPATEAPPTRAPGMMHVCPERTDLNGAGNVTVETPWIEHEYACWYIECDKQVVITVHSLEFLDYTDDYLALYSWNGADYTLERRLGVEDSVPRPIAPIVLNGPVYLQIVEHPTFKFNLTYMCTYVTPAPATATPPTRVPGLWYVCTERTDLNDTAGNVTLNNTSPQHYEALCWHIACDKEVAITFHSFVFDNDYSTLYLYSSNGSDHYTQVAYFPDGHSLGPTAPIALKGPAFLELKSLKAVAFDLTYTCVDATPAPATEAPPTRAPGMMNVCPERTDLNGTGNVTVETPSLEHEYMCWFIECDKEVVITFHSLEFLDEFSVDTLNLYTWNGADVYTFDRSWGAQTPVPTAPIVLNGPVYLQIVEHPTFKFDLNYTCTYATPAPATAAPPTATPGMEYVCTERTDLYNTTGNVTHLTNVEDEQVCWHIECDEEVVVMISRFPFKIGDFTLDLYSSNGVNYTLERHLPAWIARDVSDVPIPLKGPAYVQFIKEGFEDYDRLVFNYTCVHATPAPPTDAPPTLTPGVKAFCQNYTDLNSTAGNASYARKVEAGDNIVCWHIACDKDVVITFLTLAFDLLNFSRLDLYSSGNGVDFTLESSLDGNDAVPVAVVLNGSAFLQFVYARDSVVSFDYTCVDATPAPATDAPPTLTPGVEYVCQENTDLSSSGRVMYSAHRPAHDACWHIACDTEVIITLQVLLLERSYLGLYSSSNGGDYTLERWFSPNDIHLGAVVLNGSAYVLLHVPDSNYLPTIDFDYVCVNPTAQPTDAPPTLTPGVEYVCQENTDLNDTGTVRYANHKAKNTACWYIACDKGVVITFTTIWLENRSFLELFRSSGDSTHYTFERIISHSNNEGAQFVLHGSALVQFVQMGDDLGENDASTVEFDYTCVDATPVPATDKPATDAPPTLTPGVEYVCQENIDLNDTGTVLYESHEADSTACWHIACETEVVITFLAFQPSTQSSVYLYSAGVASGRYTLERAFSGYNMVSQRVVLDGSALVQFRGWDARVDDNELDFEYVCKKTDTSGVGTAWPYIVLPLVGVLSIILGVALLTISGVCKTSQGAVENATGDEGVLLPSNDMGIN